MTEKLKKIRRSLRLDQMGFAEKLGLTQTDYAMIEDGEIPLPDQYIQAICSIFGVNETWLRSGKGNMYATSPYEKEFMEIFETLTFDSQDYLVKMAKELLNVEKKFLSQKAKLNKSNRMDKIQL